MVEADHLLSGSSTDEVVHLTSEWKATVQTGRPQFSRLSVGGYKLHSPPSLSSIIFQSSRIHHTIHIWSAIGLSLSLLRFPLSLSLSVSLCLSSVSLCLSSVLDSLSSHTVGLLSPVWGECSAIASLPLLLLLRLSRSELDGEAI